ncbi:MAG TPA: DUF1648 domain-containing protein [bacterium]|nr:DUF1648 domain-containing protein [bacterium]
MNKKICVIWGLVFLAMVGYLLFIENDLPDHLAVHFDINGNPNGFQSKDVFIAMFLCFIFLMNGLFLALFWGISRLPTAMINIPWKKYWFATDERKIVAFEKLRAVMGLTGIFICTAFLFTEHVIYQANTNNALFVIPINVGVFGILFLSVFFIAFSFIITRPPTEE